ncbi:ParA family protein [Dyella sp.]|uniref:ParA family protein n=1 Tax=Dyella sp. TaxID=1869338 RepID=UPI003F80C077
MSTKTPKKNLAVVRPNSLGTIVVKPPAKRVRKQKATIDDGLVGKMSKLREDMPTVKSVCFFNNKGGVGKTSLVANLAAQLGLNCGARVLVVDADPQCNLTQYVLSEDDFLDAYKSEGATESIYSVIHPLSVGKGYTSSLPIRNIPKFGFDIVLGDPRLALKEDLLAQDWRDARSGGTRGLRTTFVFSDLIKKADNYDFVFFDMGPSLGAINRALLLSANYFVVPMSIDIFSLWAIQNISEAIRIWSRDIATGLRLAEDPSELDVLRATRLKFLGYVTQQHKERSESGSRRIVEAYNAISSKIPDEIESRLGAIFSSKNIQPHLGDIKHLASLAPKSQTLHVPMINVTAVGSYASMRKQARNIYTAISGTFIDNLLKSA